MEVESFYSHFYVYHNIFFCMEYHSFNSEIAYLKILILFLAYGSIMKKTHCISSFNQNRYQLWSLNSKRIIILPAYYLLILFYHIFIAAVSYWFLHFCNVLLTALCLLQLKKGIIKSLKAYYCSNYIHLNTC